MRRRNVVITILLSCAFMLMGAFIFRNSYIRLYQAFKDFGLSVAYYFCMLFGLDFSFTPTVNQIPDLSRPHITVSENWGDFTNNARQYFITLFSSENFKAWGMYVLSMLGKIAKVLVILLPCIIACYFLVKWLYRKENTNHDKDTVPLRIFKYLSEHTYQPIKRCVLGYIEFLRTHGWIWKLWIVLWAMNFNLATIAVEFFAFYFVFAIDYDFEAVWTQIVKLTGDLGTPFRHFPYWCLGILAIWLFKRFRDRIARSRLRHFEAKNCGFIRELPIVSMSCGSMGKKKTTLITDMALSQEVMFRQQALEIIEKNDMKFPYFPWISFEKEIQTCIDYGVLYNLVSVKDWVALKRRRFLRHHDEWLQLYGYDYRKYGLTYDNGLQVSNLFEVLETYALAYFVYLVECSLIVSNYSIRSDNALMDAGNFPLWNLDFFPQRFRRSSRHSKILDYDILRLGKKIIENNPNAGSFEFGVLVMTEVGKERGNNLELREVKKATDETNQKNDMLNAWLKMCRHSAMIDNIPFIKVFTDEQRPESWGADARDLCDIINIISSSATKLALPFYTIEEMLSEMIFNKFINLYYDFRFRRGDNTLLVYLFKKIAGWLWRRNIRIYNKYGFCTLSVEKQRGTMDGKVKKQYYYLMNAKIYRRRFCSDCFADYFNDMARRTHVGLQDYLEYVTEKASVPELLAQNSYFINSLYGGGTP